MTYIWDLDGTLIDSYPGILDSLMNLLKDFDIHISKEEVYIFIMEKSVVDFLGMVCDKYHIDSNLAKEKYQEYRLKNQMDVLLEEGAKKTLEELKNRGNNHFIYTHKSKSAIAILKRLGVYEYFTEILTIEDNFPRKPNPEAILYLLNKYDISPLDAYYIGDRPIDILCAKNANIKGILYKKEGSPIDIDATLVIHHLDELI